jgi:hypothetical protein
MGPTSVGFFIGGFVRGSIAGGRMSSPVGTSYLI